MLTWLHRSNTLDMQGKILKKKQIDAEHYEKTSNKVFQRHARSEQHLAKFNKEKQAAQETRKMMKAERLRAGRQRAEDIQQVLTIYIYIFILNTLITLITLIIHS